MLRLAVDIHQQRRQLFQKSQCNTAAVEANGIFAVGVHFAANHKEIAFDAVLRAEIIDGSRKRTRKCPLDQGFSGPLSDQIFIAFAAEKHTDGIGQQGFPRAGLTGDNVQTRMKFHLQTFYESEILYINFS